MKKIPLTKVFWLVSLMLLFSLTACSKNNNEINLNVTVGFDNQVKVASQNPVRIEITNTGEEINGEVQCIIDQDSGESIIYAKEIQIPQGSSKEVRMMIPFYTIQKKVEFRIVQKEKVIYQQDIKLSKFISPNQPMVAIISDQPDSYRYFNSVNYNYYNEKNYTTYYGQATAEEQTTETIDPVVFYFDTFEEMNAFDNFEFFNFIVIGASQNLVVDAEIEGKLLSWVSKGNTLLFETGEDYQRLYSFLPSSITNYQVERIETVTEPVYIFEYPFSHAVGKSSDPESSFEYDENNVSIAEYTQMGQGQIINVLVDLSTGYYKDWQLKGQVYGQIIAHGVKGSQSLANGLYQDPNFIGNNLSDLLNYIPNEKRPPYGLISIVLLIYIVLVGPILYLIFLKLDKRDFLWFAIPGSAVAVILLLYIVGFGTRYEKPIMNSVSSIDLSDGDNQIKINTRFAIFNNKSGDLNIDWSRAEKVDFAIDTNYYNYNSANNVQDIKGKITEGSRMEYEVYNAPLWGKYDFDSSKVLPLSLDETTPFVNFDLEGDTIRILVNNKTPFDIETAYLQWGNGYLYIGDITGNEMKEYEFTTSELFYDFYTFLSDIRSKNNLSTINTSDSIMNSNLNLLERISNMNYYGGMAIPTNMDSVTIRGINLSDIGYDVKVNNKDLEKFNRNIITIETKVKFESGTQLSMPSNFVTPLCYAGVAEGMLSPRYYNSNFNGEANVSIYEDTIVEFEYTIPNYLDIDSMALTVYPMYSEQDYYEKNGFANQMQAISNVTYEIYNAATETFEPITLLGESFAIDHTAYVNDDSLMKIRVLLPTDMTDNQRYNGKIIQIPALTLEGKVK